MGGLVFNLVTPQGIGWTPSYVSRPLWSAIDLAQAVELQKGGAILLDARDPGDYKTSRAAGAMNLYPEEFDLLWPLLGPTLRQAPAVVVYGRYFSRWPAARVAQLLSGYGLPKVYVMLGGLSDWQKAGMPMKTPRRKRP
ncbi:MAG: rhodanese-like domain-containing protein [Deltaproteobacteria bacterium]|nr:rhodanese-like domain-containing protein [Deltaproteobacteria bacterium]